MSAERAGNRPPIHSALPLAGIREAKAGLRGVEKDGMCLNLTSTPLAVKGYI